MIVEPFLARLLARLGYKGSEQISELVPRLTPVVEVLPGAASLTPPVLPPVAVFGGNVTGGGAGTSHAYWEIESRGEGGCYVRSMMVSASAAGVFRFALLPVTLITAGSTPATGLQLGPVPVVSIVRKGTGTQNSTGSLPEISGTGTTSIEAAADLIYLPPGQILSVHINNAAATVRLFAVVQDVPHPVLLDQP